MLGACSYCLVRAWQSMSLKVLRSRRLGDPLKVPVARCSIDLFTSIAFFVESSFFQKSCHIFRLLRFRCVRCGKTVRWGQFARAACLKGS